MITLCNQKKKKKATIKRPKLSRFFCCNLHSECYLGCQADMESTSHWQELQQQIISCKPCTKPFHSTSSLTTVSLEQYPEILKMHHTPRQSHNYQQGSPGKRSFPSATTNIKHHSSKTGGNRRKTENLHFY